MSDHTDGQHVHYRHWIGACALIASGAGAAALAGLLLQIPVLASLGQDKIPMAPSTALLFLLYGAAVLARAYRPGHRGLRRTGALVCLTGAVVTMALFLLSYHHVHPAVERMGIPVTGSVDGAPIGHMSPLTALCFVTASLSYLASLAPLPRLRAQMALAWWSACLLMLASLVLLLAYLYGTPLLYRSGFIPPAATTSIAFLALGAALLALAAPRSWQPDELDAASTRSLHILLAVFLTLAVGIVTSGYLYYRMHTSHFRTGVERQLTAIAELKTDELTRWRRERLTDGAVFLHNDSFTALARRCLEIPADTEARQRMRNWLQHVRDGKEYAQVLLLDRDGAVVVSVPDRPASAGGRLLELLPAALEAAAVAFLDLHREADGEPPRLEVLVPIRDTGQVQRSLGLLVLRIDPDTFLYPFLQNWPGISRTAETLLVRREGQEVLFLNTLRFARDGALNLRLPMTGDTDLPAARAVQGERGIVQGRDYRGTPVIAALQQVPGSPWFLVARMDTAEVFAPLQERMWMMIVLVGALLAGTAAGVGLIWRQQRARFYRERYETGERLRVLSARQQAILAAVPDILMETDRHGVYAWANAPGLAFFGEDVVGRPAAAYGEGPPAGLLSPGDPGAHYVENRQRRRDGEKRLLAWWVRTLTDDAGKVTGALASARDITAQKQAEEELQQKNDELMRFTYTVSHDLKSPLVTIRTFLGYLEQDLRGPDEAAVDKDLGYIRTAAVRMSRLLDELLALSRVGRMVNPPVTTPLQDIAREALELVAGRIAARGVLVQVTPWPVTLFGDRSRLVELFQNLVDNAVKFMGDQPAPCIEIGAQPDGAETVLFVRDNGAGIDPRHRSKLFGLFEKLDPSSEGTGIGLALARRIVEVHGGRIWLESEGPGKGCTVRFTLARTEVPAT